MTTCPECGGTMTLRDVTAGFHFANTYAPTVITVPVCDSCEYVDIQSEAFKGAFRQAELRFRKKHPDLVKQARDEERRDEERRDEEIEEILERAAQEAEEADLVVDPKDARVCRQCGAAARHKSARFCFECGSPLSPDAGDPAILEPILAALHGPVAELNPLQTFHKAIADNMTPPLARELLDNVIAAVREVIGKQATLRDVHRFLTEKDFRDPIINAVENHLRKRYLQDAFTPRSKVVPNG